MTELANLLFVLRLVKLVLEIALFALLGQGVLFVLVRAVNRDPEQNFAYRVLGVVVSPVTRFVRLITPRFIDDRHVPWAALGLLLVGWVWVTFAIGNACIAHGVTIAECRKIG